MSAPFANIRSADVVQKNAGITCVFGGFVSGVFSHSPVESGGVVLTAIQVKQAEIREKPYKLLDAHGLYLMVNPNGRKFWRYKYRFNGKEKTYSIGTWRDVPLGEAREIHQNVRKLVKQGVDPSQKKKADKVLQLISADNCFENIEKQWRGAKIRQWDPKHAAKLWRSLGLQAFPSIDKTPITDIRPKEILAHRVLQRVCVTSMHLSTSDTIRRRSKALTANDSHKKQRLLRW